MAAATKHYRPVTLNFNAATEAALRAVSDREGISLTEALRRLVRLGSVVDNAINDGAEVVIRRGDGERSIVVA